MDRNQCPRCLSWLTQSDYEPGATWFECADCGLQVAVPDDDEEGLKRKLNEIKPR